MKIKGEDIKKTVEIIIVKISIIREAEGDLSELREESMRELLPEKCSKRPVRARPLILLSLS